MRPITRMGGVPLALLYLSSLAAAASPPITAEQDRQDMMHQLGITALIPGANGDEKATDAANVDEAKANPYPLLPDPLTLKNGRKVRDAQTWRDKRRPEILEDYAREVY